VLLQNGGVVQGHVEKLGDGYRVSQADGEIRLRSSLVQFVCRDLEEGYRRKRAMLDPRDVAAHLQLAQWCQRQGLLRAAADELDAARQIDPSNPLAATLQRRLQMALEAPPALPPAARPVKVGPTSEELDRMVRGMPPGTVETFVQSTQSILLNHSTSSGCHGGCADDRLQWIRTPLGQSPSRHVTQRNLYATLQWIDWENPGSSPLLKAAGGPHGHLPTAVFTDRQIGQYRRLAEWVYRVAQKPLPGEAGGMAPVGLAAASGGTDAAEPRSLPATLTRPRPLPRTRQAGGSTLVEPATATAPLGTTNHADAGVPAGQSSKAARSPRAGRPLDRPAAKPGPPQGLDPYDADVVNRQVFPADAQSAPPTMPTPAARALGKP
jgi:hypothetical protein